MLGGGQVRYLAWQRNRSARYWRAELRHDRFDLPGQARAALKARGDLAGRVKHGRMLAIAETSANIGQRSSGERAA